MKLKHPSYEPRSRQISYRGGSEAQFYFAYKVKTFRMKIRESEKNEKKFSNQVRVWQKKLKFTA